jgi:uncharacterized protein DUF4352
MQPDPKTTWVGRATPRPGPAAPLETTSFGPPVMLPVAAPRRHTGRTVLLVFLTVLAVCCAAGGVLVLLATAATRTPAARIGSAPPGLGSPVRDGKFEFVVNAMSCGHATVTRSVLTKKAQGQYCLVQLSVRNIGADAQTFADAYQQAIGPDGTRYGADTLAGVIANLDGTLAWNLINPGNAVSGTIAFDIPTGAQITTLELHDSPLSRGVRVAVASA